MFLPRLQRSVRRSGLALIRLRLSTRRLPGTGSPSHRSVDWAGCPSNQLPGLVSLPARTIQQPIRKLTLIVRAFDRRRSPPVRRPSVPRRLPLRLPRRPPAVRTPGRFLTRPDEAPLSSPAPSARGGASRHYYFSLRRSTLTRVARLRQPASTSDSHTAPCSIHIGNSRVHAIKSRCSSLPPRPSPPRRLIPRTSPLSISIDHEIPTVLCSIREFT